MKKAASIKEIHAQLHNIVGGNHACFVDGDDDDVYMYLVDMQPDG